MFYNLYHQTKQKRDIEIGAIWWRFPHPLAERTSRVPVTTFTTLRSPTGKFAAPSSCILPAIYGLLSTVRVAFQCIILVTRKHHIEKAPNEHEEHRLDHYVRPAGAICRGVPIRVGGYRLLAPAIGAGGNTANFQPAIAQGQISKSAGCRGGSL